ncbi:DUF3509 domain-containing protein [Pseudomonas mangiferae]|uniref:DUF3509 domain-containing protein n=1 Tax=Pseudomonas mangiferae TaxID=2593654 RepID=A0A553H1B5_9PSED|nr:DUF3509 domain-containing protein [Pseudomonas mangiferae]TRX75550.1 DUF3509 domain-containing protein [Pseudomonas mangiferae]
MDNPFKYVSDSFKDELRVHFSVERLDGSITLTLYDDSGAVARRALSGEQMGDEHQLQRVVQSIRFGLAIDRGDGLSCLDELSRPAANESPAAPRRA